MRIFSKTSRLLGLGACAFAAALSTGSAEAQTMGRAGDSCCTIPADCCPDPCCPKWTFRADALILHRSSDSDVGIAFEEDPLAPGDPDPNAPVFNAGDFDLGWAAGPRLSLIRCLNECYSVEASWFGIDSWNDSQSFTGGNILLLPSTTPGGNNVAVDPTAPSTFTYGSDLHSAEFNIRSNRTPWLTLLTGFRYVQLQEDVTGTFTTLALPQESFGIETDNRLYGTQVGAEMLLLEGGRPWRLDLITKAGLYTNDADVTVRNSAGAFDRTESEDAAFVGEIGIGGSYRVSDSLALRSGYQLIWLEGVALAPDQFTTTDVVPAPGLTVDADSVDYGGAFYHGAYVGVEASW